MSARKLTVGVLVSLCALAGALALTGVDALGAVTHSYLSTPIAEIPAKGPPPVEETVESPGPILGISGLALDAGDLYLTRPTGHQDFLDKFDASTGAFIAQFAPVSEPYFDFDQGLAIAHGTGETEIYVGGDENGAETQGREVVYDAAGHIQGYWNGSDTPGGHFGCFGCNGGAGVAVDNSGNLVTKGRVYVADPRSEAVDVFEPKAGGGEKYITQITGPESGVPFAGLGGFGAVAVDQLNGDLLIVDGSTAVEVFEPTALGEYMLARRLTGTPSGAFERVGGVTAGGPGGEIYVWESEGNSQHGAVVDEFSSTGIYLGHLTGTSDAPSGAFESVTAVAVDPSGDVYVGGSKAGPSGSFAYVRSFGPNSVIPDVTTETPSSVKPRSATLNGTVNPDEAGAATCRFEWGTSNSFGKVAPCEPEAVANGNSPVPVHAALSGLQTDTTYYYRLVASNANGANRGEPLQTHEFATPGPGIHQEYAMVVTSASASLNAAIDPDDAATAYYFQYGTSTAYGSTLPVQPGLSLGSGTGDVSVSIHLQGLAAGTVYHYRVVALSEVDGEPMIVEGSDQTFTTQAAGTEATPLDGRQWEMVSPPNKQGAGIDPQSDSLTPVDVEAAANGDAITYGADSPIVLNPAGNRALEPSQVISTRRAPGSWESADIETPHEEGAGSPIVRGEYPFFTSDLSLGVALPAGATPLVPGKEATVYLWSANGGYKATVTSESLQFPGETLNIRNGFGFQHTLEFVSASPDLNHLILAGPAALVPGAPPFSNTKPLENLYEWSTGGKLQIISVYPDGELAGTPALGDRSESRNAISKDGSRVVFNDVSTDRNYLRDTVKGETISLETAQGVPQPSHTFWHYRTADSEDSRIFFSSSGRLTTNSTASENQNADNPSGAEGFGTEDLYVFEVTSGKNEPLAGKLTDLSIDGNPEETATLEGVIGASEDGSYVYYVARGVLGDAAEHGATPGNNLYVVHYDEATKTWAPPHFIAALAGKTTGKGVPGNGDSPDWTTFNEHQLREMTARVSPNGRFLAFMSENSLTGYDNRDANSGVPDEEVFVYDASTDRLACASCNPAGGRPVGFREGGELDERLVDWSQVWLNRWLAASLPGWSAAEAHNANYQPRYLLNDGRLFFQSNDALVPADVNGREDVYEYEPAGVGSCQPPGYGQSASVVYNASVGGCVGLISAGTSSEESAFVDASETGGDVFFLTASKLSPQDYDNSLDVYDAHECTASAPCAPPPPLTPPPCTTGDACKPGPTPQSALFGEPSSETFSGAGNVVPSGGEVKVTSRSAGKAQKLAKALRACRKQPKRKRAGCERKARRKYGSKQARARKSLSVGTGR
jgi:hypothetical protein